MARITGYAGPTVTYSLVPVITPRTKGIAASFSSVSLVHGAGPPSCGTPALTGTARENAQAAQSQMLCSPPGGEGPGLR